MGKCVCVTMEEVRKCQAKCDPKPRKKSPKNKKLCLQQNKMNSLPKKLKKT